MSRTHVVHPGDCISSIADTYGFFADTLWEHPDNAGLREQRDNPNVLLPGDAVVVPDKQPGATDCQTGHRHTFRRRGVPEKFRAQLRRRGTPRAGVTYELVIDGVSIMGEADEDGRIEAWMPPGARRGQLVLEDGETYVLDFGALEPIDTEAGEDARLEKLGFLHNAALRDPDARVRAIEDFQRAQELDITGEVDAATRDALQAACEV